MKKIYVCAIMFVLIVSSVAFSKDYYVHPLYGNDANDGLSTTSAIKTLKKASKLKLLPGDRLLLAGGQTYYGSLQLKALHGEPGKLIIVETVRWKPEDAMIPAVIDAKGVQHGILIEDCSYLKITSIHVTGNGYAVKEAAATMRTGVLIRLLKTNMKDITLDNLKIYDMFYENVGFKRGKEEVRTANGTQAYGWGVRVINPDADATMEKIRIQNCEIENVSHTGIKLTGKNHNIIRVSIQKNNVTGAGGPGIQMSNVKFVHVVGNEVNKSGSNDDSRKWGRGSGLWTWSASNILIERNRFTRANGPGDSAGAHIDFNCDNVVLQYNFSAYNAGGFCEVLGNNYNCAYRYNISVNDGHRVKGKDGAFQEGKIFWLSGYQGSNKERKGPVNTYFYNNTIFVDDSIVAKMAIDNRSEGVLIANNIFYIMGESALVQGDQYKPDDGSEGTIQRVFFENNLFLKASNWPAGSLITDTSPMIGDPVFRNGGGLSSSDYIPTNHSVINEGVHIPLLPGDAFALLHGLEVKEDILGNPVIGRPCIGAIEANNAGE